MPDDLVAQIAGVSALAEPARRAVYLFVAAQSGSVSRDQAAEGAGLPRHTAKFHLDKLVDEGLLETEFRRLSGRQGPGAGRPSKLYRRSNRQVAVTLPERHYDLAGQILARAIDDSGASGTPVREAVRRAAEAAGRAWAVRSRPRVRGSGASGASMSALADVLAQQGYEPHIEENRIVLVNCPFHALAKEHIELVCGMNVELIGALLDELHADDVVAALEPEPGRCCVTLSQRAS